MKTIIYTVIIITLSHFSLIAHEEFFKRTSPGSCVLAMAYRNYHSCDMLAWPSYSNIGIAADWITDFPTFELNQVQAINQFAAVLGDWNSAAGWDVFENQSAWEDYARINFTNSTTIFPGIFIEYAFTYLKYENINSCEQIVVSSVYCPDDGPHTTVYLNNIVDKGFTWRQDNFWPSVDFAEFQYTVSHELGHVLGLAHCTYDYPNTIMNSLPPYGNFVYPAPKIYDLVGLNILQSPVGIEDWIEIILARTHFNVNQIYVGSNRAIFHDEWPYGDFIVEWGPWKVEAHHACGSVLVFETESSNYINIPSLPEGYLWLRDINGYVIATIRTSGIDNDLVYHEASEQITLGNVPNTFITSGTLSSNTDWRGCVVITGDITVPSGITLTIHPNSIITFQNNSSLIVNGTLDATSCELNGGLSTWGSVTFNGSGASSSVINNVTVRNGTGIRCLNGANVTISNSEIDHCTEGIYFYNSQPSIINNQIIEPVQNGINGDASGMSLEILHNTITKSASNPEYHQYQGIILGNYTNGYIAHNDIKGFMWGSYIGGGTLAIFTDFLYQTFNPNNRFRDNSVGIAAGWGGYIFAGYGTWFGKYNSIYNNSVYDAKSYQYSDIYAQYNWWGTDGAQIYVDGTSTLDVSFPLSSDPWEDQQQEDGMNIIPVNKYPTEGGGFNPDSSILAGLYLEQQGRIEEAIIHYKQMVSDTVYPGFALGRLAGIMNKHSIPNIRGYLVSLIAGNGSYKPIVLTLLAGIFLNEDEYVQAMSLYNKIIRKYPNTYFAVNALFEKFFAAINYKEDYVLAGQLLSELQSLGLTDEEFLMRLEIAENLYNGNGLEYLGKSNNTNPENNEVEIPVEYSLLGNYPNPFNPITNISYTLPYQSSVDLVIYDIMGSEVKVFSLPIQSPGYQVITWNGTNDDGVSVSSGVYLYRIIIKSLENNETFVKTSKLMLMK